MENQKYIDTTDLAVLEFYGKDGKFGVIYKEISTLVNRYYSKDELKNIILYPTSPRHLAEILNMEQQNEGYVYNGTYLSELDLEMLYNTITMTKKQIFNKILGIDA